MMIIVITVIMRLMTMRLKITTPISFFIAGGNKPVQPAGNTESTPEAPRHYCHDYDYDDHDHHDHDGCPTYDDDDHFTSLH